MFDKGLESPKFAKLNFLNFVSGFASGPQPNGYRTRSTVRILKLKKISATVCQLYQCKTCQYLFELVQTGPDRFALVQTGPDWFSFRICTTLYRSARTCLSCHSVVMSSVTVRDVQVSAEINFITVGSFLLSDYPVNI